MGALTIGIVTEPFRFEGHHRAREARKAIEAMRHAADTVVVVPNDRLLQTVAPDTSMLEAFHLADDVLRQVRISYKTIPSMNVLWHHLL